MGFKRLLAATVVALIGMLFVVPSASAQQPGGYTSPTAEATVQGNGTVRVEGSGCPASSQVDITVRSDANGQVVGQGTTTATAGGTYDTTINTGNATGPATVTIVCGGVTQVLGVTLTRGASAGPLPTTGSDSSLPLARTGVVLLALGGLAVYAARKRSSQRFTVDA